MFAMDELADDVDAVLTSLHDFLYHSRRQEQTIRIGQFAERVGVDPEQVALTLATIVADPESGITAHRRGPKGEQQLPAARSRDAPEHARFVLRVDRSAPGFPEHGERLRGLARPSSENRPRVRRARRQRRVIPLPS